MSKILTNIRNLLTVPLTEDLDATHLFLLVGLVLVMISAWLIILGYIRAATIEVVE